MKMNPFIKYFILILCLCSAVNLEAQQKAAKSKKSKRTKFVTPTPIPPDEVKTTFKILSHVFIWQPEKDTNLPPSFLYREVLEMQTDTVVIKRFYTKKPMEYQTNFYVDYGANEDNEIYVVKTEKAHYTVNYETISIWNATTKRYDKYEISADGYLVGFGKLVNLKTKRIYIRDGIHNSIGTKEIGQ
jgi:hypothetical protein